MVAKPVVSIHVLHAYSACAEEEAAPEAVTLVNHITATSLSAMDTTAAASNVYTPYK